MAASLFVPRSADHFAPALSFVFVWGVALIPAAVLMVTAIRRVVLNRALGRAVDAALGSGGPLRPGPAVVRGRVVLAEGHEHAVLVEIEQTGTETKGSKGGYTWAWTETARKIVANPFLLQLPSGELLPVTPDESVLLVDKLDRVSHRGDSDLRRTLHAELTPGEEVWAAGLLVDEPDPNGAFAGYRDMPRRRLALRGAGRGARLELSSQPRGDRYRARARFHQRWIAYAILMLAVVHGTIFFAYHARTFFGSVDGWRITAKRDYWTRSGKSSTHHRRLTLRHVDRTVYEDASSRTFANTWINQEIPARWVDFGDGQPSLVGLGAMPTANGWGCVIGGLAIVLLLVAYSDARQSSRPWWDRPVKQTGSGRIAQSMTKLPPHDG